MAKAKTTVDSGPQTFIAEVPRFFTMFEAPDQKEAENILSTTAGKVAVDYGDMQNVTGKGLPESKAAVTGDNDNLLNKVVNLFEMSKSITKATGSSAFLGVGGADVLFDSVLGSKLGLPSSGDFVSLDSYLTDIAPKVTYTKGSLLQVDKEAKDSEQA